MKRMIAFSTLMLFAPAALAATVSIEGLIGLLVWLVVLGLIFWLVWWFVNYIGLPEPFAKVARVIVALVAFLILIYLLLGILGPLPRL